MIPDITALVILAVTVGVGLVLIAQQGLSAEGSDQDPSSRPTR